MNNKITNPLLKELISEIAGKANQGRITGISWSVIEEAKKKKKKKTLKKEADAKKEKDPIDALIDGGDAPEAEKGAPDAATDGSQPVADQSPKADAPTAPVANKDAEAGAKVEDPTADSGEEDADKVKADAAKKKAELEKAKAEKDQAEKELEQQSYVKLKSSGGLQFMLNKIVGNAFKTNTLDSLASEMAQKLKITTPEDAASFEKEMALYKNVPGMVDLLSSIKAIAVEKPADETPAE